MDKDTVIKVENLSKKFTLNLKSSMLYGTSDVAKSFLGMNINPELRKNEFWSLKDISFELKKGESLGLIGRNGSGKSTLLRLISGIFPPDKGEISIKGRVGSLIAVGAGFHPHMSGLENIYLNGVILGMSRKEIKSKIDEIVDFAEIGEFIHAPVSTYSSGMRVRLGFAIAVHAIPEILLVDEILSVGDMRFKQKSLDKIAKVLSSGTSVIFVSHQMLNVQKITQKAILLEKGQIVSTGDTQSVVSDYYKLNDSNPFSENEAIKEQNISSYGITYKYLKFFNQKGEETRSFTSGEDITVEWKFKMKGKIENPTVHFALSDGPQTYNGYVTKYDGLEIDYIDEQTLIRLNLKNVNMSPGRYSVSIGIWDENFIGCYFRDYESTGNIEFSSDRKFQGRFQFQHNWEVIQNGNE